MYATTFITVLILLLALAVLAAPLAAGTQPPGRVWRVGVVLLPATGPFPSIEGFLRGLTDLGYTEGGNLIVIQRSAEG